MKKLAIFLLTFLITQQAYAVTVTATVLPHKTEIVHEKKTLIEWIKSFFTRAKTNTKNSNF